MSRALQSRARFGHARSLLALGIGLLAPGLLPAAGPLRVNEVQYIGSHNSYHAGLAQGEAAVWQRVDPATYAILTYSHPRLGKQLDDGVRQVELDVYGDAQGGRYAHPAIIGLVAKAGLPADAPFADPAVMARPGFKVMHIQDLDQRSNCQPLKACLRELRAWSAAHPAHLPIFVLLETEETPLHLAFPTVEPEPFDTAALDRLDAEIESIFPRSAYIAPDDVRGDRATLNDAVRRRGWPTLDAARGKFIFLLDQHSVGKAYLIGHPSLRGRPMFTNALPGEQDAAFMELNDGSAQEIAQRVREGYLVRTRTDVNLKEAATNDTRRRDTMLSSGAQLLSTDFPDHEAAASGYVVAFPHHQAVRCNPQLVNAACTKAGLTH